MEEGALVHHLGKDARYTPDVHWARVPLRAQEDLWRTVPQRHHLVGVRSDGNPKRPSEAKVGQFDGSLLVDEKVLGLQVPVQHSTRVAEHDALENLVCVAL